jgi:prepilin-type N-terminal cleavage/methylation domain-containing protein
MTKKIIIKRSSGFTLLELLIAIGLFSILVAIAAGGYVNALRTDRQVSALISAQSNASLALEQIAREARTGYLFCHSPAPGATTPANCGTCAVSMGQFGLPPSDPEWKCPSLDFYNAQVEEVDYSLAGGTLMRQASDENGGAAEAITGDGVDIKSLQFILQGQLEGDHWNPRITILMQVAPSSTDSALSSDVLYLQTTVSSREIDCGPPGGC